MAILKTANHTLKRSAKVETYNRSAEYAATELARKPQSTSKDRADFTRAVKDGASDVREYLLSKLK